METTILMDSDTVLRRDIMYLHHKVSMDKVTDLPALAAAHGLKS